MGISPCSTMRWRARCSGGSGIGTLESSASVLVSELTDEYLDARVRGDREAKRIVREMGLNSFINVPMVVRDRIVGVITFVAAESGRLEVDITD